MQNPDLTVMTIDTLNSTIAVKLHHISQTLTDISQDEENGLHLLAQAQLGRQQAHVLRAELFALRQLLFLRTGTVPRTGPAVPPAPLGLSAVPPIPPLAVPFNPPASPDLLAYVGLRPSNRPPAPAVGPNPTPLLPTPGRHKCPSRARRDAARFHLKAVERQAPPDTITPPLTTDATVVEDTSDDGPPATTGLSPADPGCVAVSGPQ